MKKEKFNLIIVLSTWVITLVVCIVLGINKLDWFYYLLGVLTALMNFGLMQKATRRMERAALADPDKSSITARKSAIGGYGLRMLVIIAVLLTVYAKEIYLGTNPNGIWCLLLVGFGYITLKFVMIFCVLLFRGKVNS